MFVRLTRAAHVRVKYRYRSFFQPLKKGAILPLFFAGVF